MSSNREFAAGAGVLLLTGLWLYNTGRLQNIVGVIRDPNYKPISGPVKISSVSGGGFYDAAGKQVASIDSTSVLGNSLVGINGNSGIPGMQGGVNVNSATCLTQIAITGGGDLSCALQNVPGFIDTAKTAANSILGVFGIKL